MEAVGWCQLEELSIAGSMSAGGGGECVGVGEYGLGDEALARLVRAATRLRLLDLRGLQRLTDSGLVRVPAWDLQHLFLGGCKVTRQSNACLELICEKWSHSLLELDLSWSSAARVLDDAIAALAEAPDSKLRILNLCGSSVTFESVKKVLLRCPNLESLNLSSCRALPRGMKRLFTGKELQDLKDSVDPLKAKLKEESSEESGKKKRGTKKSEADSKSESTVQESPSRDESESSVSKSVDKSPSVFQEPKSVSDSATTVTKKTSSMDARTHSSPDSKTLADTVNYVPEGKRLKRDANPKLLSPITQSRPDSSSTPRSDTNKIDQGSPQFSPVSKPDSQVQNSPDVQPESVKSNSSWNLGQFKTTPTHKSEASPLNRLESHSKLKHSKIIEQCSPTTSLENKPSPETHGVKQDIKNPNNWNCGNYSPMPRQDNQFSSQRSPYSAQPSPAQPSPYSTQPSPYSTQPSPYSSQPSPYSAQPSPDTSQIVKPDMHKSAAWNPGNFSPMPKHPFSPHPSTHTSPDTVAVMKGETIRTNPNKTPGQYSPMSRQDRLHHSPYSPRPSVDNPVYSNKKSPGVGSYSPMIRPDCHLPSPDATATSRATTSGRSQDVYGRSVPKAPDLLHNNAPPPDIPHSWGIDRFNPMSSGPTSSIESLIWGASLNADAGAAARVDLDSLHQPAMLNTPQPWTGLPSFDTSVRTPNDDLSDPWTLGQFRVEPPHHVHNTFVEQNVSFESLSSHLGLQSHASQFLDDGFSETSRVE